MASAAAGLWRDNLSRSGIDANPVERAGLDLFTTLRGGICATAPRGCCFMNGDFGLRDAKFRALVTGTDSLRGPIDVEAWP